MKRIRMTNPALRSRADAENCLGQIRALSIEQHERASALEAAKKALDEQYAGRDAEITQALAAQQALLCDWAEANPSEFGDRKSIQMIHGLIGWRIGQPKLSKKSKAKWEDLADIVADSLGSEYVRTKREVDRERIIADRGTIPPESLREIGLAVVQEESFFIEPRLDQIDRVKEAA
mgnify:CR=1 FL=1